MDLSKAFDTLNRDLLLAKLHANGFYRDSLKVLRSYLTIQSRIIFTNVIHCFIL